MQIGELVHFGTAELTAAGVPDCTSDVHLLLGHCLGKSRTQLLISARQEAPAAGEKLFRELLARRKRREPLAYILGEQEFWSLPFHVNPAVLIPRPETEFLLETVLKTAHNEQRVLTGAVLDLCCGSGVIAIILALELGRKVVALDLSADALAVTRRNCLRHGVGHLVQPVLTDLLTAMLPAGCVSLIVSNPPYVSSHAVQHEVEPEVREYEPWLALDGGERGLELIQRIHDDAVRVLAPGGHLFMEIGHDQGAAVRQMFGAGKIGCRKFQTIDVLRDYAGRDRVLHARME